MTKNSIITKTDLLVGVGEGTLIDIETTGLDSRGHEIVTLGFVTGSKLKVVQRKSGEKEPYYEELREILSGAPGPYYAYNSGFEDSFFREQLGLRAEWVDLMGPWRELSEERGLKWPKLDELVSEPEMYFDISRITGRDVPTVWKSFLASGSKRLLELMMRHSRADLFRELYLLVQYPHLYKLREEAGSQRASNAER